MKINFAAKTVEVSQTFANKASCYACPCCGMSVRATKVVNIACMDCDEQLLLVG